MEKLIHKDPVTGELSCDARDFDKFFPLLHAYEETGLTPEQVKSLQTGVNSLLQKLEETKAELVKVRTEKDSIISVLKVRSCDTCKHTECDWSEEPCDTCRKVPNFPMWEWGGRSEHNG